MSNLTPDDVDLRLTATKAELTEEDQRLWLGLEDEKISRIAGDEANKQFTELVQQQNSGTESRLSTEVIHRSEGDVSNLNSLNAVAQALSDYRIKTDLEINNEVIARKALGVELNSLIDTFMASWDHDKFLIYRTIQEVQDDVDGKYVSMDTRITKYEQMLSDITADSIQITMDNGEINMGAWTILSQAREWDLQIIGRMKDFQIKTEEDLNQALEDIQNSLPVEQDIVDRAIEALSNAPIIKGLDEKIADSIADISTVHKDLLTEITTRQNEMVAQAQNTADELKKQSDALNATITAEADARIDALQREAQIRQEQLLLEAQERTAEIDQRIGELDLDIDADLEAVNKRIDAANNTITELNENLDRDVAAINDRVDDVNTKADDINVALGEQKVELNQSIEVISAKADAIKAESDQKILDLNSKADGIHDDVSAETAARIAAVTALNDGLTSEIQHRKDGDQVITTALENYKSSNDTALANVRTEIAANVTATTANATKIDALDVRLTTNEEETGEAKALAASATQKAETALTETSALASQMTTVNASIDGIKDDLVNKADAAAFNQLKAEVVEIDGKVLTNTQDLTALKTTVTGLDGKVTGNTSAISELSTQQVVQGDQITQLTSDTTALKNSLEGVEDDLATKVDSTAFNELSTKVDKNASDITVQAGSITKLQSDLVLTNQAVNTKASASALTTLDTKVSTIDGKVTSNTTAITNLSNRVSVTEGAISKKADASALSSLDTKVTAIDGKVTTQGTSITKLQNDLTTTNQNVATKADATALSALSNTVTEQGGKITSNSSAITDLTNKVTIVEDDVAKKADATAVSSLSTKVGTLEGTVTSQGTAVTKLQNDLALTNTAVSKKAESSALNALDSKVTQQGNTITSQGGAITKLQNDVSSMDTELDTKASSAALSALDTKVTQQGSELTSQGTAITKLENDLSTVNTELDTKADSAALNALDSKVTTIDGKVTSQGTSLTSLTNRVTKNEGDISKKAEATALTALTTRVSNAEGVNTSQGTAITKLTNDLATTNGKVDTKADSTALTTLDNKVTSVDGKVTTNTNSITSLNGKIATVEGNLATKLDSSAISNYYTKQQTDDKALSTAAGEISKYDASLVIGGVNQLLNSEGERTSGAASNREYLLYERNAHLKQFYEDNLGKDITVSFEIKVPVAGAVQVYSSNNSAHTFNVNTPWLAADTWTKVAVTVKPTRKAEYATQVSSTLEFYGTYGTGRIPTVRKVQLEAGNKATAWSPSPRDTQAALDANSTAIQDTNAEVTRVDGRVTTESSRITALTGRVDTVVGDLATKADASALNSLTTRVATEEGKSTSQGNQITKLTNDLATTNNKVNTKADATAVQTLDNKVTQQGKDISSQGASITKLTNDLATTNQALETKASVTALNALDTKVTTVDGKVTSQGTQIAEIKTTLGGIESDLDTKADASALSTLDAKVTKQGTDITSQGSSITKLQSDLTQTNTNVSNKADSSALTTLDNKVTAIDGKVTTQGSAITKLQNDLVITDQKVETKADANALSTLSNKVEGIDGRVTANSSALNSLTNRVTSVEGVVTKKADSTAVNALTSRVETAEGQITSQGSAVTKLQNDLAITANTANAALPQITTAGSYKAFRNVLNYYIASSAIPVTTNLVISTPITFTSKMTNISIKGYMYKGSNTTIDLRVGFYAYNLSSFFLQTSVTNNGSFPFKVRLAVKDGKVAIILSSNTTTTMAYPQFVVDAEFGYTLAPDTWKDGWSCAVVTEAGLDAYGVTNITTPPIFDPKTEITANATAIQTLDNKVTQNGNDITSISTAQTALANRVTTVETGLTSKADSSAVQQLDSRVVVTEGKTTSNSTAITNLQNTVNHATTGLSTKASSAALTAVDNKVIAVDGRVTTTNSNVATLTGRVSTVENGLASKADVSALNNIYTKSETDAKATSLAAGEISKYDASLVIGGTNLLTDSNFSKAASSSGWSSNGGGYTKITDPVYGSVVQTNLPSGLVHAWLKLENAVEYTYSALVKPSVNLAISTSVPLHYHAGLGNLNQGKIQILSTSHTAIEAGKWTRISTVFKLTGDADSFRPFIYGLSGVLQLAWTKLERGNKATDWTPSVGDVQSSLDANATAIQTTNTEVSRINDTVSGHTTQLSNLTASIAGKADTTALNALTVRVANEESKSSSQATSITNLNSSVADALKAVTISDTRSTNQPPSWYWSNYARRTVNEFKTQTAIGVGGFFGGTYCNLETNIPYGDASGGHIVQTATSSADPSLYVQRVSISTAAWGAWVQPIKDLRDTLGTKASASALSTLDTKVADIDGKVTTQASSITQLQTDVSGNSSKLIVQGEVVDGLKASYVVKTDVNGLVAGYGLYNTGSSSAFGVNADFFYVGKGTTAANSKKPFMVLTTTTTIGGVTYPAGTWIDVALIANATIGTAHIANAAITNAKIADATIESAKIKSIKADKIEVGNPLVGPITSSMVTGTSLTNAANLFNSSPVANASFATYGTGTRSATSGAETSYIQVDVGSTVTMPEVRFFFRGSTGRKTYIKLKASVDGIIWDYIMGSTSKWETIDDVPPSPGSDYSTVINQASFSWYGVKPYRYLRLYGNGSSASATNELVAIIGNASGIVTKIGSEGIVANAITADKIKVDSLSAISSDLGTIKVGSANIEDLSVSTIKIQDNAVTVPAATTLLTPIQRTTSKNPSTYAGGVTALVDSSNYFGDVLSLTIDRKGGKCRVEGSIWMDKIYGILYTSSGSIIPTGEQYIGVMVFKNGNLLSWARVPTSFKDTGQAREHSGVASVPVVIDDAGVGLTTYSIRVGLTCDRTNSGTQMNVFSGPPTVISATLAVMELKK